MRLVERAESGAVELNYMWLPTWIGMNAAVLKELEQAVSSKILGLELCETTLELAHASVLEFLENRFPQIKGLFDYLDGIKYVEASNVAEEERRAPSCQAGD